VKSSDPGPVAPAPSGEKPQVNPEAPAPHASQPAINQATTASPTLPVAPGLGTNPAESALDHPSALVHSETKAQATLQDLSRVRTLDTPAKTLAPHPETSVAESTAKSINELNTPLSASTQPTQVQNARTMAEPESTRDKQNTRLFSSNQSNEAKGQVTQPSTDRDFTGESGTQGGKNSGSPDSYRPNEAAKTTARTAEPRTEAPLAQAVAPARKRAQATPPTVAKRADRTVLHRRDQGAVLRGYRIPVDLHRQAERAKLGLASRRGSSLFWDELLQGAIDLLLDDIHRISAELSAARRAPEMGTPNTRVLQAAIRHDQDLRLRMLRIDLEELDGATVRLEEIWTWLIRQVVKNEG
jgi:general stress protein YciG